MYKYVNVNMIELNYCYNTMQKLKRSSCINDELEKLVVSKVIIQKNRSNS